MWEEEIIMAARSWCRGRMLAFTEASMIEGETCMLTMIADFGVERSRTAAGGENDDPRFTQQKRS
jgi:hypothetical protein